MKKIIISVAVLLLSACGSFKSITQTEELTYLQLVGERSGIVLMLDETTQLDLEKDTQSFDLNGKTVTKIVIKPGQHRVTLMRSGNTIVDRKFYVSEGNGFEVTIP